MGGGSTRWGGTAFNCPETSNEIILLHSHYATALGTANDCNQGTITARSIAADMNCYTSQLNITVQNISSAVIIQCTHCALSGPILIGESTIMIVSGN